MERRELPLRRGWRAVGRPYREGYPAAIAGLVLANRQLRRLLVKAACDKGSDGARTERKQAESVNKRLCLRFNGPQQRSALDAIEIERPTLHGVFDRLQRLLPRGLRVGAPTATLCLGQFGIQPCHG